MYEGLKRTDVSIGNYGSILVPESDSWDLYWDEVRSLPNVKGVVRSVKMWHKEDFDKLLKSLKSRVSSSRPPKDVCPPLSDNDMKQKMTKEELENLVACYIVVEGYTDLRSIYNIMCQEYPGEFERKQALEIISKVLKEQRPEVLPDLHFDNSITDDEVV